MIQGQEVHKVAIGWLCHTEGSPIYKIVQAGNYEIDFSALLFSGTAGTIAVGLFVDGILIPSTVRGLTVGAAGFGSVSFDKIEKVCCKANSTITVGAVPSVTTPGTGAVITTQIPTIYSAIFNITKIG